MGCGFMIINNLHKVANNSNQASSSQKELPKTAVTQQSPSVETITADASVLKAYNGIFTEKAVPKEQIFDYLKSVGEGKEQDFDEIYKTLADKDGYVTEKAFNSFKDFKQNKNKSILFITNLFNLAKENGQINYNALKLADLLTCDNKKISRLSRFKNRENYYIDVLNNLKNKDGSFNEKAINFISNHFEILKPYLQLDLKYVFSCIQNNSGEFDINAIDYMGEKINNGAKLNDIRSEIHAAKDGNGNFSYEIKKLNEYLSENFDKYQASFVKNTVISLTAGEKNKNRGIEFIELAKSLKDDKDFMEVWTFIKDIKSDENDKSKLGYDKASYDFVKKIFSSSYKGKQELEIILKKIAVPYDTLSKKDITALIRLISFVPLEETETFIDASIWKAGDKKGQFSAENLEKYLNIYSNNRGIMGKDDIAYIAGCLALEEDNRALSLFEKLHNLRWTKKIGKYEIEEMLDKRTLNFILELSCMEKNGTATRPCFVKVIENIEKLFSMELPMSSKNAFENFILIPEFDVIQKLEKVNFGELGINTGQISQGIFKNADENQLLKFKDYLKDYLKDKNPKTVDINLNKNISSVVELTTGTMRNKTLLLYDFKKGEPTTEIKSTEWNDRITKTQKDFLRNTVSKQKFLVEKDGPYGIYQYNVLQSQEFQKYDKDGNLLYTEIMEKSPVEGVFNVTKTYTDGRVENICSAQKTKEGNDVIEKHMMSFDGTKTDYRYEDDPAGNRICDYKITDKNGKILMNQSVTFEVIDENHFVSSRNNKKFDIQIKNDKLFVKNLQNKKTAAINLENFTKSSQDKILPLLKQLPGEELFAMDELNLESFTIDASSKNACFSPTLNSIMFSNKYLDLGVALHEWGHGKDELVFKEIGEEICKDPELNKIYKEEKTAFRENFSDAQLEHIGYFAADYHYLGNKAIKEGIAETNTLLSISPKNSTQSVRSHYWQHYFPKTIAYVSTLLN